MLDFLDLHGFAWICMVHGCIELLVLDAIDISNANFLLGILVFDTTIFSFGILVFDRKNCSKQAAFAKVCRSKLHSGFFLRQHG